VLKKTITYKSFDGEQEFTEDFYFHLSKAELVELETSRPGGLSEWVKQIVNTEDVNQIVPEFKKLLLMTYGKRSDDGRRFIKNQQLRDEFASTEAFSELFIELVSDADKAAAFVNGILPSGLEEQVAKMEREPNRAERRRSRDDLRDRRRHRSGREPEHLRAGEARADRSHSGSADGDGHRRAQGRTRHGPVRDRARSRLVVPGVSQLWGIN
jgi:hypothetical protein